MLLLIIFGAILLIAGAVCVFLATRTARRVHAMAAAETLSIPDLEVLRSASDEVGGKGNFRRICEVVGTALPSDDGLLSSELTGTPCVWHRYQVTRRYLDRDSDGRGSTTRTETVAQHSSAQGFGLLRDGHTIGVDPNGARTDAPEQTTDRFEPRARERSEGFLGALTDLVGWDSDDTLGYQYTEWVIREGAPLYILGEVHDKIGPLVVAKPANGKDPYVISTRSEEQLVTSAQRTQRWLAWGGAAGALVGIALLVTAFVV